MPDKTHRYRSGPALAREIDAGLGALRYPRAVLTEGGEDRFTADQAARYARGGGQRVLFACGLRARVPAAERAAAILNRAGVPSRVILGKLPDTGQFIHWYNGPVASETQAQLDWLLEGDRRW